MTRVIFACVSNAGQSQMAAALFNRAADPAKARAESAGTKPGRWVHPEVVDVMKELGIDLVGARPQLLTAAQVASAQLLVTLGCADACPDALGVQREDWPVDDPRGQSTEHIRDIRDDLQLRVTRLIEQHGWAL